MPIYSVLIRTNIEYAHHQTSSSNSKTRRAAGGSSSGTGSNNGLIPSNMLASPLLIFSYVRDNLHYGKSGDQLNIFKTIRTYYDPANRDTPAAADPPFFARLDRLIEEEEELRQFSSVNDVLKRERERSRYSTGYSTPATAAPAPTPKAAAAAAAAVAPTRIATRETCNPRTTFSLTPANYGDFVLTIPVLDFVKPIVRDGYVILNGGRFEPRFSIPALISCRLFSHCLKHYLRISREAGPLLGEKVLPLRHLSTVTATAIMIIRITTTTLIILIVIIKRLPPSAKISARHQ